MSEWVRKRFWKDAESRAVEGGFGVFLDGRPLRTPAKAPLVVPTFALAEAIAAEWAAQEDRINPQQMPATRAANAAIDKVQGQKEEVSRLVAAYGETDLICHRAEAPKELVARQAAAWDPLVQWAADVLGARLEVTTGVMHRPQPPESLAIFAARLDALDAFELTALHDLVAMSGSLVIGLAAEAGFLPPEDLWRRSRIDEDWQAEQWGEDAEAKALAESRRVAFMDAWHFLGCCR